MRYDENRMTSGSSVRDITGRGTRGNVPWQYFGFTNMDNRITSGSGTWGILCVF